MPTSLVTPGAHATIATRTIELLAPLYAVVCPAEPVAVALAVALQRTPADWIKLVFPTTGLEEEVACVNKAGGCPCDYARFLRALLVLTERRVLHVDATYVVSAPPRVATLQMRVGLHSHAASGASLKDFDLVLCHLQAPVLSIVAKNGRARREALASALAEAQRSSCHVVGCRLHPRSNGKRPVYQAKQQNKAKLSLPDVFHSLTSQMEVDQMEIRDDATYVARMTRPDTQVVLTDLPTNALQSVVCFMDARGLAALSSVCSLFQHMAYEVVPGLQLVLYEHQRRGLKWMLHRETPSLTRKPLPHPFILPCFTDREPRLALDLIDRKVVPRAHAVAKDACGGMFCDEPGLGKTITMLALLLRTKGQTTENTPAVTHRPGGGVSRPGLRSSGSRGRSVRAEDLVSSCSSLVVVPDPLVEHWEYQVEAHVATGALRVFVDKGLDFTLPRNAELAQYDVVITSFSRLAREWKNHRPASALEQRMPDRYGFEGPQRYADGTLRGEVSSLLTVHWVRVIVDEGHKLGGQTPSDLMQMARLLCAERRWVMTGTPTPNTLQSADLRYMHGLLVFLRNLPYGNLDGQAWVKAIARPFEQNEQIGFYRLQHLLSRIMMRHTKDSIREILPDPVRRTVFIDPTPSEYAQYNGVAAAVRANLVITNMDPKTPGNLHPDSLLNPINRREALRVVSNLRTACCGGSAVKVSLAESSRLDTINMLSALAVEGQNMAAVIDYLRRVKLQGMTTECGSCKRQLQLLMIMPCGHLCCADCVEDRIQRVGPSCFRCNAVYDREAFIELQPGFEFEMVDDVSSEPDEAERNPNGGRGGLANQIQQQQRQGQRQRGGAAGQGIGRNQRAREVDGQNVPRRPRRAMDLSRDIHFIDASKAFYAVTRIKELKEEFARGVTHPSGRATRRQARYLKAIIFSQFKDHIWHTKVAFAQQGVPTADFIAGIGPDARMKQLLRFRKDPSVNVLLLTEVGSHGLDLSFVTHIFLMDEIWDKSLEQQVVSRAHRMGASQAVVVEQLWMRGSVESKMFQTTGLDQQPSDSEESKPAVPDTASKDAGSPGRSPKKPNTGYGTMFNAPSKKRKRHKLMPAEVRKAAKSNKSSLLQRKLDYVLNNLRLLGENMVAEPGQVRFSVVDEHEDVIRQAIHVMPNRGARAITFSTASNPPADQGMTQASASTQAPQSMQSTQLAEANGSTSRRPANRTVTFGPPETSEQTSRPGRNPPHPADVIVIDSSSSSDEHARHSDDASDSDDECEETNASASSACNGSHRGPKRRVTVTGLSSSEEEEEDDGESARGVDVKTEAGNACPALAVSTSMELKSEVKTEVKAEVKTEVKAEVKTKLETVGKTGTKAGMAVLKLKAKAVSFAIIDDDETESE